MTDWLSNGVPASAILVDAVLAGTPLPAFRG
jgi:hypothetical protein